MKKIYLFVASVLFVSAGFAEEVNDATVEPNLVPFHYAGDARRAPDPSLSHTVIEITDEVLVHNVSPLGLNIGGDSQRMPLTKVRDSISFEGNTYRSCVQVLRADEDGVVVQSMAARYYDRVAKIYEGADAYVISGKARGERRKVTKLEKRAFQQPWEKVPGTQACFVFDKPIEGIEPGDGLIIERMDMQTEGSIYNYNTWWTSKNLTIVPEPRTGSGGKVSCLMDGTDFAKKGDEEQGRKKMAYIHVGGMANTDGDTDGPWTLNFWMRATEGEPECLAILAGSKERITPTDEWKEYQLDVDVTDARSVDGYLEVTDGKVLVDEIVLRKCGDKNPTPFVDPIALTLKEMNIGILRCLQMGGATVDNMTRPRTEAQAFLCSPWYIRPGVDKQVFARHFSIQEFYELCEYIGAEPWYGPPGTMHEDEVEKFMEYLGAPADVGYGKRRAAMCHPEPWTKTIRKIHIEFGNEAWNQFGPYIWGGYNGPDYWKSLIARAKASPYYDPDKMVFHMGSQNRSFKMAAKIMKETDNTDRICVAPYIWDKLTPKQEAFLSNTNNLLRYAMAYTLDFLIRDEGPMMKVAAEAQKSGIELSTYEYNYHMTHGKGTLPPRHTITFSQAGGLNIINGMLAMQQEFPAREQCFFTLAGRYFVWNKINWPGWGVALNLKPGSEQFRPNGLALTLCNQGIFPNGDLLATKVRGADPRFSATGPEFYSQNSYELKGAVATIQDVPCLWSYAYRKGNERSLILMNLDVGKAHEVEIQFPGTASGVERWIQTSDSPTANNEVADDQQVKIEKGTVKDFFSGYKETIPPHTLIVYRWTTD